MNNRMSVLCGMLAMLIVVPGVAAGYEYECQGEVDHRRRGVHGVAMRKEANGTFSGGWANIAFEARQEEDVLVMSFAPVQNPAQRRVKRARVPDGKDRAARFATQYKSGTFTIVCK